MSAHRTPVPFEKVNGAVAREVALHYRASYVDAFMRAPDSFVEGMAQVQGLAGALEAARQLRLSAAQGQAPVAGGQSSTREGHRQRMGSLPRLIYPIR